MTKSNESTFTCLPAVALCTLAFATSLNAQEPEVVKSRSWDKDFGGYLASASVEASAQIKRRDQRVRTLSYGGGSFRLVDRRDAFDYSADLEGSVSLFGRRFRLGTASADLWVHQGYYSRNPNDYAAGTPRTNQLYAKLYAKAFGTTIVNETRHYSSTILSFSDTVHGFKANKDFWVGPVPVTVRGSVGGGCSAAGSVILDPDYDNPRIGMSGEISGYASASASAGVGITGASAGVRATLRFLSTGVALEAAGDRSGISGYLRTRLTALAVNLYLYVEALWWEYDRRITGWSTNTTSTRYNLF